jgi:catechol 2,3-dioxygenase-like lactoylglutathione lyase family enzyme
MTTFTGISHLDLTVTDAEASADWYVRVLGLRRARRADLAGRIMIVLVHPETRLVIGLNQHHATVGDRFDEHVPGLDHVGFAVASREELTLLEKHLTAEHVDHSPVTDSPSGSGTALVFRDPDNIQLEFWWSGHA